MKIEYFRKTLLFLLGIALGQITIMFIDILFN